MTIDSVTTDNATVFTLLAEDALHRPGSSGPATICHTSGFGVWITQLFPRIGDNHTIVRGTRTATSVLVVTLLAMPALADSISTAKQHFEAGTRAYDLGHYDEAVKEYEAAYRAKDDPALLFNIGQAYRGQGDASNAIRAFRSYLRRVSDASNRPEVEARIADLQKVIDEQARAKEKPPQGTLPPTAPIVVVQRPTPRPPTPTELHAARTKRIIGLAIGGFGVVSLAVGGVFTGLANDANRHIVSADMWSPASQDRRDTYQALDATFFALGGAAVAVGITFYLLGRHDERKARFQ